MSTKHTPGKWHTEEPFNVWSETGALIARVNCPMDPKKDDDEFDPPWEMGCANARLISATPDLYEACLAGMAYDREIESCANDPSKMATHHTAEGDTLDTLYLDWITKTEAAIAKAEGKP